MNKGQKLTPKYWVAHNIKEDDVYLETADKCRDVALNRIEVLFGEEWLFDDNLRIELIEIKLAT